MVDSIRKKLSSFPVLEEQKVHYLDNAATTQKPGCVINAAANYYRLHNAN
ncbi:MAG: aminotransferase class V-fold PLP-dependent enzyme, partial [Lachnospiraceae bacterium]|nr:aminotransferase class V-fold PLP-dependent enzyme [Lachnospiraceae bacterium]